MRGSAKQPWRNVQRREDSRLVLGRDQKEFAHIISLRCVCVHVRAHVCACIILTIYIFHI